MATAALHVLHTAALRLREAADRFIVAFEQAAHEAAAAPEPPSTPRPSLPRGRGREAGVVTLEVLQLASRSGGITAADVVAVAASHGLKANTSTAAARLNRLAQTGKLVAVRSQYSKYGSLRYFATAERAESWAAEQGPAADAADPVALPALAAMVEADAPAVAAALAVIAPPPPPAERKPAKPPRKLTGWQENTKLITVAAPAPVVKATGEVIVPPDVKITRAPTPVDTRFHVDPKTLGQDPESFSAQWQRLRGEGAEA